MRWFAVCKSGKITIYSCSFEKRDVLRCQDQWDKLKHQVNYQAKVKYFNHLKSSNCYLLNQYILHGISKHNNMAIIAWSSIFSIITWMEPTTFFTTDATETQKWKGINDYLEYTIEKLLQNPIFSDPAE